MTRGRAEICSVVMRPIPASLRGDAPRRCARAIRGHGPRGERDPSRRSVRRVSARSALQVGRLTTRVDVQLVRRDGYRVAVGAKGGGPRMVIPRGFSEAEAWRRARSTRSAVSSVAGSLAPR